MTDLRPSRAASRRAALVVHALVSLAVAACGTTAPTPCDVDPDCPIGMTCDLGSCVALGDAGSLPVDGAVTDGAQPVDTGVRADAAPMADAGPIVTTDAAMPDRDAAVDDAAPSDAGMVDVCGDGAQTAGEACDDGNRTTEIECSYGTAECTACNADCALVLALTGPTCGDGTMDPTETCDDGNALTETECAYGTTSCTACDGACASVLALTGGTCGDGGVQAPEECDYTGTSCTSCDLDALIAPSGGGNGASYGPVASNDARFVAWYTRSTNFDPRDTTTPYDVYVRDIATDVVTLVSHSADGMTGSNADSTLGGISGDGSIIVFHSQATNLDAADTDASNDVYAWQRSTGTVRLVSAGTTGTTFADNERVSGDGTVAVFRTDSPTLTGGSSVRQVVLYDFVADSYETISVDAAGASGDGQSAFPVTSADGHLVVFDSVATNLIAGDVNGARDVFVRDRTARTTTRVSIADDGTEANGASRNAVTSADGRYVAFISAATNLVPGDTNGVEDVFVRDRTLGTTTRVSVAQDGTESTTATRIGVGGVSVSGLAVFATSYGFDPSDTNTTADIYLRDPATGALRLVSNAVDGTSVGGFGEASSITPDGTVVVYQSNSGALVTGVAGANVFRREL